jgi:hypothetical protein
MTVALALPFYAPAALLRLPSSTNATLTLSVFPEEGVKVKLNNAEVKEVAFKDLSSLKVTLTTALTVMVELSAIEVGKEVEIKGKIEPAMSVPIVISVMAPNGSVKTVDATTSEDGSFSVPIRLERAGSYTITASYAGGELYEPSSASAVVEARAPPAPLSPSTIPEALWYVIVVVVVVVVVVSIVIAVLKGFPEGITLNQLPTVLNNCKQPDRLGVPRIGSGPHPLTCEAIGAPRNPKAPHTPFIYGLLLPLSLQSL